MKAIIVTCPHCGARLQVAGTLLDVRCEYCGTSARIQKRTRVFERVLPPPPLTADAPREVAVQRRSRMLPVIAGIVALGLAVPVLILAMWGQRGPRAGVAARPAVSRPTAQVRPPSSWLGTDSAILVDLDRDGTLDIIGRARQSNPDSITILAVNGATAARLWESASLGGYSDVYRQPLVLAGDLLVFASQRGELRAFSTADGSARWTAQLDERVERLCGGDELVIAIGADGVARAVGRQHGTLATAPAPA
ncbi:MAG: PQQ-binding-like beta-propeller repeat protein, partial [Myxococcota bacterium]|nr:PQQ-binding-like beta-propeller repeat protein [Myxococcota bacterium]